MIKSTKSILAVSTLVLGLWAAPGLYAQQATEETPPQGGMMQDEGGMMQGQMDQDMMGMMNMMQQMGRMMDSCAEMMDSMAQDETPQTPEEGLAPEQEG